MTGPPARPFLIECRIDGAEPWRLEATTAKRETADKIAAACRDLGAQVRISRMQAGGIGWEVVEDDVATKDALAELERLSREVLDEAAKGNEFAALSAAGRLAELRSILIAICVSSNLQQTLPRQSKRTQARQIGGSSRKRGN